MAERRQDDPLVRRPPPDCTASEAMARIDARNMVSLVRDLTLYMPPPYKERLLKDGSVQVKLGKYTVLITVNGRFESPTGEYGRTNW